MAGILKVDQVQSDSNLAFNIAGSNVAFMNATSLQMVGSNVSLAGTNVFTSGKLVTSAQPTGAVLQAVQTTTNSNITTGSNSFVASGLTLSITPLSSSNKILIMLNGGNYFNTADGGEAWTAMYRNIGGAGYSQLPAPYNQILDIAGAYGAALRISHSIMVLDSPATTSSITYQPYFATNGSGTAYFNANSPVLTFTLMEIAG